MSLDQAIKHGKEHRKKYRHAKAVDTSCRNHGDCPHCKSDRTIQKQKMQQKAKDAIAEYFQNHNQKNINRKE